MTETKKKKRIVLLDAHAILHRAYHALPEFTSAKGEPTGALYGLSAMLMKLIGDLKPDYLVACYDLPEPTYRHEVYEGYKAQRKKAEEDLVTQINRSRDIFTAFNIPIYEKAGFEADDVLATIVEQTKKTKDLDVVIASGDMDTMQLVDDERVYVYTFRKGMQDTILYDEDRVEERFGFKPTLIPDFKGLRGDPSDNIIGISGIGEKTATILITNFGTVENIYKTLKKDPDAFKKVGLTPRIVELLKNGEEEALFSKMLALVRRDVPLTFTLPKKLWREGVSPKEVLSLFSDLGFRTLSVRARSFFGLSEEEQKGGELSVSALPEDEGSEDEWKKIALGVWLLNSDTTNPTRDDIEAFTKITSLEKSRAIILEELKKKNLLVVYETIEVPLLSVVEKMERRGVKIDAPYLKELSVKYHRELEILEKRIYGHAGREFNINSPRQLGDVLFDTLGLAAKNQKKTSTGMRSTRESELEKLRDKHPIIADILAYRELQKLLSTYIDNIPLLLDASGRLHATFQQAGTTTGRMSSQNPNLQNIPIRTDLGRNIRKAFVADEDFVLVALDYSQIELRLAAILSGDEKLQGIFKDGGDVHAAVAAQVFNVPPEMVDSEMRRQAKVINFGILYGMGVNALRENLGTDRTQAQHFYNEYFKNFSGLASYLEHVKREAERKGYTETLFGRRRYFEGIRSTIPYIKASAERMAINAPIQGTQADIIKIAMVHIDTLLSERGKEDGAHLLLQVHDELVYEVLKGEVDALIPLLRSTMESVLSEEETNGVPILVAVSKGKNWGEMEKLH